MEQIDTGAVLTVDQVAKLLAISRISAYKGIRTGEIPSIKIGRSIRVHRAALARMLEGREYGNVP